MISNSILNGNSNLNISYTPLDEKERQQTRLDAYSNHLVKVSNYALDTLNQMDPLMVNLRDCDRHINRCRVKPFEWCYMIFISLILLAGANAGWYFIGDDQGVQAVFGFMTNAVAIFIIGIFANCIKNRRDSETWRLNSERNRVAQNLSRLGTPLGMSFYYVEWDERRIAIKKSQYNNFNNPIFLQVISDLFIRAHRYREVKWETLEIEETIDGTNNDLRKVTLQLISDPILKDIHKMIKNYSAGNNKIISVSKMNLSALKIPNVLISIIIDYLKIPDTSVNLQWIFNDIPTALSEDSFSRIRKRIAILDEDTQEDTHEEKKYNLESKEDLDGLVNSENQDEYRLLIDKSTI